MSRAEVAAMRKNLRDFFTGDTMGAQESREAARIEQQHAQQMRQAVKASIADNYVLDATGSSRELELELKRRGLGPVGDDDLIREEEELAMSYLLMEVT
jgi:hypothetical protein